MDQQTGSLETHEIVIEASAPLTIGATLTVEDKKVEVEIQGGVEAVVKYPKWVTPSKVKKIRELHCFEVVRRMLVSGVPTIEVARAIQEEFGELTTHELTSVKQYVDHYRATLPKGELMNRMTMKAVDDLRRVKKTIDVVGDLQKLKELAFARLEIAVNREKSFGMLLPNVEKSFGVALDIVSKIAEIQEKAIGEMDDNAPGHGSPIQSDLNALYDRPGINETLTNPASRMRVAKFMETALTYFDSVPDDDRKKLLEKMKPDESE